MRNVFVLALVCYATWGGTGLAAAPPASSHPTLPAHVLLAKQGPSPAPLLVEAVRHHAHKHYTRVVLNLSGPVNPEENKDSRNASIALPNVELSARARRQIEEKDFPRAIAVSQKKPQTVSIVLDVAALRKYKLFTLDHPDRVVVDLFYAEPSARVTTRSGSGQAQPASPEKKPSVTRGNDLLIIIDPGHGGKDPGTIGRKGTREKTIVLQISKYLRDLLQKRDKAKVLLTRTKDVFLALEDRVKFAKQKKRNWCGQDTGSNVDEAKKSRICLFVSVHVNSHPQKSIQGLEIYYFGEAKDPRALEVAARENGMKFESDTPPWKYILMDSLKDYRIKESQTFAETTNRILIDTLRKTYKVKNHGVKTAPFYVLRFTTMPSILAEVGFVSNSMEENRLKTQPFQKKLAEGIYQGIQAYLKALRNQSS